MKRITLSIIDLGQLQHGVRARCQFDSSGGTLGSHGADWQLIDRERRIHPVHCEIRWIENSFCAIDRCGRTYLNDSQMSLGRWAPVQLKDGDHLRIGGYRLLVNYQQDQSDHHPNRCSLEELFEPKQRVLDALAADLPTGASGIENAASSINGPIDICQAFDPAIECDPLAALDATPALPRAQANPLKDLLLRAEP